MKHYSIIGLVILFNGLTYAQTTQRPFNISSDIGNFSKLMTDLDTIVINADLCICEGVRYERDIITKRNDSVFIQVFIDDDIEGKVDYGKRVYKYNTMDTLNFENFYFKLQKHIIPNHQQSRTFQIIHNSMDTLNIYTYGLIDKLNASNYLAKIKDKIYFDMDYYKPTPIPPKPIGLSDEENLDSIIKKENKKELDKIANEVK